LNNLHSLHRDLENKYQRALEEIDDLEQNEKKLMNAIDRLKNELIELNASNVSYYISVLNNVIHLTLSNYSYRTYLVGCSFPMYILRSKNQIS
jgi:uncharacterized coiled-coil DUF342 family protein